jgi:hypothetical protein
LGDLVRLPANFGDRQAATDFARQKVGDFGVPRNRFGLSSLRIAPQGVGSAFALEKTAVQAEVAQQRLSLHWMVTV